MELRTVEWIWGRHPEANGWVVAPADCIGDESEGPDDCDLISNYAGAIMADHLYGEDVEPYLTIVDDIGGPGERVFINTDTNLRAIIAALEARGDVVIHDEIATSRLVVEG